MFCDTWDDQWWYMLHCMVHIMVEMLYDACEAMSCIILYTLWHRCFVIQRMTSDDMCCIIMYTLCYRCCVIHLMQWVVSYCTDCNRCSVIRGMTSDDMCCTILCIWCHRCCVMYVMQWVVPYCTHCAIDALWYMRWPVMICVVLYRSCHTIWITRVVLELYTGPALIHIAARSVW